MHQFVYCRWCGTQNPVGVSYCSCCLQEFHYTCPHCGTWVNSTNNTCPLCYKQLNWAVHNCFPPVNTDTVINAASNTVYATGCQPKRGRALSTILLLLFIGALSIVAFDLAINSSNRSSASSEGASDTASVSGATSLHATSSSMKTPVAAVTLSPAPNTTPTPAATSEVNIAVDSSQEPDVIYNFPVTTVNSSASGSTSSTRTSAYLQQLWPGWGHCSGGSCR